MTSTNDRSVAIVIPYFRKRSFIQATLNSALDQSVAPVEIIVVDDGSEDDVAEVILGIDPRVRLIVQANAGPSTARNRGWRESIASYILFLDADDLLLPDSIKVLLDALESEKDSVAVMGFERFHQFPGDFRESRRAPTKAFFPMPNLLHENVTAIHGVLVPRVALTDSAGFDESMKYCEDWDLWVRLAILGYKFVPVDYTGAFYRSMNHSLSSDQQNMDDGHTQILKKLAQQAILDTNAARIPKRILANELRIRLHKYWRNLRPRAEWISVYRILSQMEHIERQSSPSFSRKVFNVLPFRFKETLRYMFFGRRDLRF